MKSKNIAVLVSGGGTNLQAIIDAIENNKITNGTIKLVVSSSKDAYALERAKKAGIDTAILERKNFKNNKEYTIALKELLENEEIDLIVLAGFMTILTSDLVKAFPNRIINIHPSLIPSFCGEGFYGLKVHEKALEYGVKVSGATVHFVDEGCDSGPIILQKAIPILEEDTPESLQKRIMEECEWNIMPEAIDHFCNDRIKVDGRKVSITE